MEWVKVIISLCGVIGLIIFMFYLMRKLNKSTAAFGGRAGGKPGNRLRIIDRAGAGRDSSLLIVSVSGKLMLVGVSTGKIEKLCDLDISEEEYFKTADGEEKPPVKFSDVLGNFLNFSAKKRELTENHRQGEGEEFTVEPDNKKSNEGEGF